MEKSISELELELAELRKKELFNRWEDYLTKLKEKLTPLIGKTILSWSSNGNFSLYKIKDVKEQYYVDKDGFYGQWSPRRWLELITDGYLTCSVADHSGKYYKPSITNVSIDTFKFKKISKKAGTLDISKLHFNKGSISDYNNFGDGEYFYKIGYDEYNNKQYCNDPSYSRAISSFFLFSFIVDDSVYDEALRIHTEHVQNVINFWEKFKDSVSPDKVEKLSI